MDDEKVIQSYVWHNGRQFFVSTINRDSSAMMEPPAHRYSETLVWEIDWKGNRGDIVAHTAGVAWSITKHQLVCLCLHKDGKYEEDNE